MDIGNPLRGNSPDDSVCTRALLYSVKEDDDEIKIHSISISDRMGGIL